MAKADPMILYRISSSIVTLRESKALTLIDDNKKRAFLSLSLISVKQKVAIFDIIELFN